MYTPSSLKLGVECGVNRVTRQTFSSGNATTKLETALKEAWDDSAYWVAHPNILISRIKIEVDKAIADAFESAPPAMRVFHFLRASFALLEY